MEFIKNTAALLAAMSTIVGFIIGAWVFIDAPLPVSLKRHQQDIMAIGGKIDRFFNETTRVNRINRLEILRGRILNLNNELQRIEDAVALHQRASTSPNVSETDKVAAESRIRQLTNQANNIREQIRDTEEERAELVKLLRINAPSSQDKSE